MTYRELSVSYILFVLFDYYVHIVITVTTDLQLKKSLLNALHLCCHIAQQNNNYKVD